MKDNQSFQNMDELIFERRNKKYGAYELRSNYKDRLLKAFLISISIALLFFLLLIFKKPSDKISNDRTVKDSLIFKDIVIQDKIFIEAGTKTKTETKPDVKTDLHSFIATIDSVKKPSKEDVVHASLGMEDSSSASVNTGVVSDTNLLSINAVKNDLPRNMAQVDKQPEFPGGMNEFYKFLKKHIHFTDEARTAGLSAKIFVQFIIDEEGRINEITAMNKIGFGLEDQVINVLKKSPKWSPGIFANSHVKTVMIVPVSFLIAQ